MSKLNQIQQELQAIDQARFQKLCDAYLLKHFGFESINPVGSVIGADKVSKGVPDTVFTRADGTYALAAYTTQASNLPAKLRSDLKDSLSKKTGIPRKQIGEVILCHNRNLDTPDELTLMREGKRRKLKVTVVGLQRLSFDLYDKYPFLAKDFLGIDVDTGQILPPDQFVAEYQKNAFSTPLDTAFHFREKELTEIAAALEGGDLVVITGSAGVGKSRFMLEAARRFKEQKPTWQVSAIYRRGADIFQDLKTYFSPPGNYLIVVDDANRLSGGFDYVLQLLRDQNESRRVKIVVTVRDYARNKIVAQTAPYGGGTEISLGPLSDEDIATLLTETMGIKNFDYLKRITQVAQGNPRIAMMAAKVAVQEQTLHSIIDVSSLYETYFKSVREELEEHGDDTSIKVAGIVSFLRTVDRSNETLMTYIDEAFGLSPSEFWRIVGQLHEAEVLDLYENEIARFSDQILATYLFYYAAFRAKVIDFSMLLDSFFPDHASLFADALNPIINNLGADIESDLKPSVDKKWRALQEAGDSEQLLKLLQLFFFVKETDAFLYVRNAIREAAQEEIPAEFPDLSKTASTPWEPFISLLGQLRYSKNFTVAIDLALDLVERIPSTAPSVANLFRKTFGFRPESHLHEYDRQQEVVRRLWQRTQNATNVFMTKLFLAVAEHFLRMKFDVSEPKGKMAISIITFGLRATPSLNALREELWQHLFAVHQTPEVRQGFVEILATYCHSGYLVDDKQIIEDDASRILPFLANHYEPSTLREAAVAQEYLRFLRRQDVSFEESIGERFVTEATRLADLLVPSDFEKFAHDDWREFEKEHKQRLAEYVQSLPIAQYPAFFEECRQIREATPQRDRWSFDKSLIDVFSILAEEYPDRFVPVVTTYLDSGNPLHLWRGTIVGNLIKLQGAKAALETLQGRSFDQQTQWLFDFFALIPQEEIAQSHLDGLIALYRSAVAEEIPPQLDALQMYLPIDPMAAHKVVSILLERLKAEENLAFAWVLGLFFSLQRVPASEMPSFFGDDLALLKNAYLTGQLARNHSDHDGAVFNAILDIDRSFIRDYLNLLVVEAEESGHTWIEPLSARDLLFIWQRSDYADIIREALLFLYECHKSGVYCSFYLPNLFGHLHGDEEEKKPPQELIERRVAVLSSLIQEFANDSDFMEFVFGAVGGLTEAERRTLIGLFLENNRQAEVFERLSLEPSLRSWWGSAVPLFQKELEFLESLLPLVEGPDYLEHRLYLEKRIEAQQRFIETEKKRDFMRDL